jgi:predicted nucleic acid-binding Zn finger protein
MAGTYARSRRSGIDIKTAADSAGNVVRRRAAAAALTRCVAVGEVQAGYVIASGTFCDCYFFLTTTLAALVLQMGSES